MCLFSCLFHLSQDAKVALALTPGENKSLLAVNLPKSHVAIGDPFKVECVSRRRAKMLRLRFGETLVAIAELDDVTREFKILSPVGYYNPIRSVTPKYVNDSVSNVTVTFLGKPAKLESAGYYNCEGSDEHGSNELQSVCTLKVGYPPDKVQISLRANGRVRMAFQKGDIIEIRCTTRVVKKANVNLHLYLNSVRDLSVKQKTVGPEDFWVLEKKLNVTRPEMLHGTAVKCVAENEFGKEEDGADLNVECE